MIRHIRQQELYDEAASAYGRAFERLVRAYEADPEKQRDLLQEVHFAVWRSFESYESRCSIRTWVYRVAHNTAASHVIKEHRKNAMQWVGLEEIETLPDSESVEEATDRELALKRLMDLIRRLRPPDRQMMFLYLEGMDADSIGEVIGVSAGAVRVQIHRIKTILTRRFHRGITP
jgi:RNA polymerase sigma-70 factor (ECF subfamily)